MKFLKVCTDNSSFRMATEAEARAHHEEIKLLLDEWTIALLDGGKVDGRGYGGQVSKGDFKDQCGEKIVVAGEGVESIGNLGEAFAGLMKADGEPDYKAVRSDEGGKFDIPSGWSVVGVMDPAMPTLMPRFMKGPQDVDDFNNGKMVIITNKAEAGAKEDWVVVEKKDGEFQAPPGYQIIEMDESNFGEYMPRVQHLLNLSVGEKINEGTVKFALKGENKSSDSVSHYKMISKEKDGDFNVPEGWNIIPMLQLLPYMDPTNDPGDNPQLSKFMMQILSSGAALGFPESKAIITNKKVALELDGMEVHKIEREEDRSFKIQEGWVELPKSDENIQKMINLVSTKRELELFQKGDLLFVAKKEADGEPDYKAVRSDEGGKFDIPSGWSVVGMMDPAMPTLMPRFMTGPQDVDDFNNGKMVIITNKAGAGAKEDWVVVEKKDGEFQAPPGYQIIQMDESNFGEYMPRVQHLLNKSVADKINSGSVKFALKD